MTCNRRYCLIVALLLLGVFSGHAAVSLKGTRPNIIFFLGDDQNITDQSVYGNTNVPTPTTQAFSEEGLVFERAFATMAMCAPSRSALYTGRYSVRNGCFVNHTEIRPRIRTLPQYLAPLGYNIILAGKSHVGPDHQFPWTHEIPGVVKDGKPRRSIPLNWIRSFLQDPEWEWGQSDILIFLIAPMTMFTFSCRLSSPSWPQPFSGQPFLHQKRVSPE